MVIELTLQRVMQTGKRHLPLYYIGSLAFALVFAYLLQLAWFP